MAVATLGHMTDDGTDLHLLSRHILSGVPAPGCYLLLLPVLRLLALVVHARCDCEACTSHPTKCDYNNLWCPSVCLWKEPCFYLCVWLTACKLARLHGWTTKCWLNHVNQDNTQQDMLMYWTTVYNDYSISPWLFLITICHFRSNRTSSQFGHCPSLDK